MPRFCFRADIQLQGDRARNKSRREKVGKQPAIASFDAWDKGEA